MGKYGNDTGQTTEVSCTGCGAGKYGVATGRTSEASCTVCGVLLPVVGVSTDEKTMKLLCSLDQFSRLRFLKLADCEWLRLRFLAG